MQVEFYWLMKFAYPVLFCRHAAAKMYRQVILFPQLKSMVVVLLAVFLTSTLQAQEKEGYIFRDSSVMEPADDVVTPLVDSVVAESSNEDSDEEDVAVTPDSVLISNELFISADSVRLLKAAKPFAYAKNLDSMLKSMKKEQEVKYTVESNTPSKIDLFFSSGLTKAIFWSVAVGLLLFILVKLFLSGGFLQRKSTRSKVAVVADEEEAAPDVSEYNRLIKQAIAAKDYRLATRYLYLQSLQYLIEKGVVTYAADKTNYEYLSEMGANLKRQPFAALTLKYEYVWYGGFTIDETAFAGIQQSFTQFNNAI